MGMQSGQAPSIDAVRYMIHHVFLPSRLPQKDDYDARHEVSLLRTIIEGLEVFEHVSTANQQAIIQAVKVAVENAMTIHGEDGAINEYKLTRAMQQLCTKGGVIPLCVQAQNAGVIISKVDNSIQFEAFELSPTNESVMSTKGRLKRCFPAIAVAVPRTEFDDGGFQGAIAQALAKMSHQLAAGTRPEIRKARQMHAEDRDTNHPKLVTEYLMSMLRAVGDASQVRGVWKKTREEVLWRDARMPWRRSRLWLLIRVTVQLMVLRHESSSASDDMYKHLLISIMTRILNRATAFEELESDVLYSLSAKISRRLLKLRDELPHGLQQIVRDSLEKTHAKLQNRWSSIIRGTNPPLELAGLDKLDPAKDIDHRLPDLDIYIQSIYRRQNREKRSTFTPKDGLPEFSADELPKIPLGVPSSSKVFVLASLESWIESSLQAWISQHAAEESTCARLRNLMSRYHDLAVPCYSDNPESYSLMLLNILELWKACDESACAIHDLLRDYDPGIPVHIFESLLLPFQSQLNRLNKIERYLLDRKRKCKARMPNILCDFGLSTTFGSRYFDQSSKHQELLSRIEQKAQAEKLAKLGELTRKKDQYSRLMADYDRSTCDMKSVLIDRELGIWEDQHFYAACKKHQCYEQAKGLDIEIQEWPLPSDQTQAKCVVFELMVPLPFQNWRDTTIFLLFDVMGCKYLDKGLDVTKFTLSAYDGLSGFLESGEQQYLILKSSTKAHAGTHRSSKPISTATETQVCLNNGLTFHYYDSSRKAFTTAFSTTEAIPRSCSYTLPKRSSALERFLWRPSPRSNGLSPNTAVATRANCPAHMTLTEYDAYCSVPLGHKIQWSNILTQLSALALDFGKLETHILLLQIAYQAGPSRRLNRIRDSHEQLNMQNFGIPLVQCLTMRVNGIKENWESWRALSSFVHLAARLLSTTSSVEVQKSCTEFLALARKIAFDWMKHVRGRARDTNDDQQQTDLMVASIDIALVCLGTFDIDQKFLEPLLAISSEASIYIQSSVSVQECSHSLESRKEEQNGLRNILLHRWRKLSYRAAPSLKKQITRLESPCLNVAISKSWPGFVSGSQWNPSAAPCQHWLYCTTAQNSNSLSVVVHINLLTFELLVDGRPLARLPSEYSSHSSYPALFGGSTLEAVPATLAGMEFSCKDKYHGNTISLGLQVNRDGFFSWSESDLLLNAMKGDQQWDLVPKRVFHSFFPDFFVEDHIHWYHRNSGSIEFRTATDPWSSDSDVWSLTKSGKSWRLSKNKQSLVSVKSNSARTINSLFSTVAMPMSIHIYLQEKTGLLEVEAPQLGLGFYHQGGRLFHSRQYPRMVIDECQNIDTLVGLKDRLVLCHAEKRHQRQVVIPDGPIQYHKTKEHVRVSIQLGDVRGHSTYRVDSRLEKLVDSGNIKEKILLCYLHALTSYCLPDPLTYRTGTEQAIDILRSGSIRSFETLSNDDLTSLSKIASLTPKRRFYPERERVMQTIEWDEKLSSLTQHDLFYTLVKDIFKQSEDSSIFYGDAFIGPPSVDTTELHLLERDSIRASTFRTSTYGAEAHTLKYDGLYQARDTKHDSESAKRVFTTATAIHSRGVVVSPREFVSRSRLLWERLKYQTAVKGILLRMPASEVCFDSKWLDNSAETLLSSFLVMHDSFVHGTQQYNKFRFLTWLSAVAFAKEADIELIHTIASMYTRFDLDTLILPTGGPFNLQLGIDIAKNRVKSIVRECDKGLAKSSENALPRLQGESSNALKWRRQREYNDSVDSASESVASDLYSQWPCETPRAPTSSQYTTYFDSTKVMANVKSYFKARHDNLRFYRYLCKLQEHLGRINQHPVTPSSYRLYIQSSDYQCHSRFVGQNDVFRMGFKIQSPGSFNSSAITTELPLKARSPSTRLKTLIDELESRAATEHERSYAKQLRKSSMALSEQAYESVAPPSTQQLQEHLKRCERNSSRLYSSMEQAIDVSCGYAKKVAASICQWPRISTTFFLGHLRYDKWEKLTESWKRAILEYALAITEVQRAERLLALSGSSFDLVVELSNVGHKNWDPFNFPESVLLEVESGILIRTVQEDIARTMRNPPSAKNAVMQLNMGEGKSSVIVPIVATSVADGDRLVRVIVGKPQSKQMASMLIAKLGGLLGRRIYRMPFSRALRLDPADIQAIDRLCKECIANRGVLLVQPEHVLSFRLMGIECAQIGKKTLGRALLQTQHLFNTKSRDIVDESDENFSVKFELVYTMGSQQHIELSPERWHIVHRVLKVLAQAAKELKQDGEINLSRGLDIEDSQLGKYPRIRILQSDAEDMLMKRVASLICKYGFPGFPVAHQSELSRKAIYNYMTKFELEKNEILSVEKNVHGIFWTESTQSTLLLLRGLFAGGILPFALRTKRWRVNYGLTWNRSPESRLAVPYRAKDSPAPRAEFSHPDAVLVLTSLSYYYGGLEDSDLFGSFEHLINSDKALAEFSEWINSAPSLPNSFRTLAGINLKDRYQCIHSVFPHLKYSKGAIDYFLSHLVFPKEIREFPSKISASGWDLAEPKANPTTGFSGTNDSQHVLPLDIQQLDLPAQRHTNALVLEHILGDENSVHPMPSRVDFAESDAQHLLATVSTLRPKVRVILDVGAQVLEMNNFQVATAWLEMSHDDDSTQAVIYVNDDDEVCVLDRRGHTELLQTSPYSHQLGSCLVYLDEAHTRGIDLRLPKDYRAAVTLGASITKDRLVQGRIQDQVQCKTNVYPACMRMRKLGKGQSVVFCVPEEIRNRIIESRKATNPIEVADVLLWSFQETLIDLRKSLPLWAVQGRRFERQSVLLREANRNSGIELTQSLAEKFLEDEAQSLDHRYRPRSLLQRQQLSDWDETNDRIHKILQRCRDFESTDFQGANVEEEQERELSPEIEKERQVEKPMIAKASVHELHPDLNHFAKTGELLPNSKAVQPAFESLRSTIISRLIDVSQFPQDLLVTHDYAKTIKMEGGLTSTDVYQRPVQWILSSVGHQPSSTHLVIVSPFEAHELIPLVTEFRKLTLHTYAPRTHQELPSLDGLDLYNIGRDFDCKSIPRNLIIQLNIFAGQSYFNSRDEYKEFCDTLRLACSTEDGRTTMPDGFIPPSTEQTSGLRQSPVKFIKALISNIRRHGEAIDKTHVGRVFDGELLGENAFES